VRKSCHDAVRINPATLEKNAEILAMAVEMEKKIETSKEGTGQSNSHDIF
jgi:hypothetical protein